MKKIKAINYGEMQNEIYFDDYISISHNVNDFDPSAKYKVLTLCTEPAALNYFDYNGLSNFDLILTNRQYILDSQVNSKYMHSCTGATIQIQENYLKENKISFITSSKLLTNAHQFRINVFNSLSKYIFINDMKFTCLMTPPRIESKNEILNNFKFHIVMENSQEKNYFTEKIIDCFVSKTIPVYWGCPNIGDFFNMDGIITFDSIDELFFKLNHIKSSDYEKKLDAINENYLLALGYNNFWETLSNNINSYFYGE